MRADVLVMLKSIIIFSDMTPCSAVKVHRLFLTSVLLPSSESKSELIKQIAVTLNKFSVGG
jgi:hypothetical protein